MCSSDLLVVIAIIGTLVGLLLPAVQAAREAARKSQCSNNVRQMALGALNYESARRKYPTSGEGKRIAGGAVVAELLNVQSFFTQILPYVEQGNIYNQMNVNAPYWATPANQLAAATNISTFLCPSNGITKDDYGGVSSAAVAANSGSKFYGQTHYMPVAYTDLSPVDGTRQKVAAYKQGLLSVDQTTKTSSALDGTSKTVIFFEDAGRNSQNGGKRSPTIGGNTVWLRSGSGSAQDIVSGDGNWADGASPDMPVGDGVAIGTCPNRWADSDNASGVSGAPVEEAAVPRTQPIINNFKTPMGGPSNCSWSKNNCGPNDEPFSTHAGGGCFGGFADGAVNFLSDDLDVQVLRQLSDPQDGQAPLPYGL